MKFQKHWLASAAVAAAMSMAGSGAQALEVSGTLDPVAVPGLGTVGLDVLILSFTPGDYLLTVTGPASPTLFSLPSLTFKGYTASIGSPGVFSFLYSGLSGDYKLSLSGSVGAAYTIGVLGGGTVTLVPEPESIALALAGLGVVGLLGRRRLPG